ERNNPVLGCLICELSEHRPEYGREYEIERTFYIRRNECDEICSANEHDDKDGGVGQLSDSNSEYACHCRLSVARLSIDVLLRASRAGQEHVVDIPCRIG